MERCPFGWLGGGTPKYNLGYVVYISSLHVYFTDVGEQWLWVMINLDIHKEIIFHCTVLASPVSLLPV